MKAKQMRRTTIHSDEELMQAAVMLLCAHHTHRREIEHPAQQAFCIQRMNGLHSLLQDGGRTLCAKSATWKNPSPEGYGKAPCGS